MRKMGQMGQPGENGMPWWKRRPREIAGRLKTAISVLQFRKYNSSTHIKRCIQYGILCFTKVLQLMIMSCSSNDSLLSLRKSEQILETIDKRKLKFAQFMSRLLRIKVLDLYMQATIANIIIFPSEAKIYYTTCESNENYSNLTSIAQVIGM